MAEAAATPTRAASVPARLEAIAKSAHLQDRELAALLQRFYEEDELTASSTTSGIPRTLGGREVGREGGSSKL